MAADITEANSPTPPVVDDRSLVGRDAAAGRSEADRRVRRSTAQRTSTLRRLAVVWFGGLAFLAVIGLQQRVPVEDLLLDASVVGGGRWYSGFVTSIGAVLWTVAATAAFAAGYVSQLAGRRPAAAMLVAAGLIVSLLLFDDLFLLHSNVVPSMTGAPKMTLVVVEGLAVALWLAVCRAEIARTRWELLVASAVGFAASLGVDVFMPTPNALLLEDGAKLLGIIALALWSVSTGADVTRSVMRSDR